MREFLREWWAGAKLHPGWFWAFFFGALYVIAGDARWFAWAVGLVWFVPVILTCRSVEKANRPSRSAQKDTPEYPERYERDS